MDFQLIGSHSRSNFKGENEKRQKKSKSLDRKLEVEKPINESNKKESEVSIKDEKKENENEINEHSPIEGKGTEKSEKKEEQKYISKVNHEEMKS